MPRASQSNDINTQRNTWRTVPHLQSMKKCLAKVFEVCRCTIQKHLKFCSRDALNDKSAVRGTGKTGSTLASTCRPWECRRQTFHIGLLYFFIAIDLIVAGVPCIVIREKDLPHGMELCSPVGGTLGTLWLVGGVMKYWFRWSGWNLQQICTSPAPFRQHLRMYV